MLSPATTQPSAHDKPTAAEEISRQLFKLNAALALTLSAPINLVSGDKRLDEVLSRLSAMDLADSKAREGVPCKPYSKASVVQGFGVMKLCEEGWELHNSFEPAIKILCKGSDKIQVHSYNHFLEPQPGMHNGTPRATEAWKKAEAEMSKKYETGVQILRDGALRVAPDLVPILQAEDLGELSEDQLLLFCARHALQANAFVRAFAAFA